MASTYSSSLSLQLMATGENASTWGDVTNTNLGTALEQSIAGSTDVNFSGADVTLTQSASNASQPYRYMRLRLVGAVTATQNLVVPTIQKVYIVSNTLTYPITVKTAAGTGISIPVNKTTWVYVDGVNVVDAVTTLTSLTLGSPLGIASGGTGLNTIGTNGQVLTVNGSSLSWITPSSPGTGTVTNVTTTLNGITVTNSTSTPVFSGTLGASSGGTGLTSAGTSGNVLVSNGSGWISSASSAGVTSFSTGSSGLTVNSSTGAVTINGGILGVGYGGTGGNTQASARSGLGLGSAATYNTGTSGANVPLLNGVNTWSGSQTIPDLELQSTGVQPTINLYYSNSISTKKSLQVDSTNTFRMFNAAFTAAIMSVDDVGDLTIPGALSKGSGSFRIPHPLPALTNTHQLVHSFIEGPQCDLIYRGSAVLVAGQAIVNIDHEVGMTEGTFVALCRDVQCFTTNESDWTAVKGSISGNILTIQAQDPTSMATVSWMVIGERHDKTIMDTYWTDADGNVILEPLAPVVPV